MVAVAEMLRDGEFWRVLLVAWLVTPVGMVLVGLVFESRLVPLWRYQSRASMPGGVALGVMFAIGWYLYAQIPAGSFWGSAKMPIIGLFIGCTTCYLKRSRFNGENNYPPAALRSPTKRYHDYVLYVGYLTAIIAICVPAILFGTTWSGDNLPTKIFAMMMFGIWLFGMYLDVTDVFMRDKTKRMHVTVYQPLWRTLPMWWEELKEKMG